MKLIFGLGNPGRKYAATRHNIGFDAITALSDAYRIPLETREWNGISGKGTIAGEKVLLIQPQTYMNASGDCVRGFAGFYKVAPSDILVIYDDIALDTGRIRIRAKGSAGGHNGMKSIIAALGTEEFPRLRIGVGAKPDEWDLADHVLARFPKEEEALVREGLKEAVSAVECLLREGTEAAMNRFNGAK